MPPTPSPRTPAAIDPSAIEQAVELLQQRIDELQANLSEQNKLATLGMVTAVLAHEFNNILTPMISYTTFALSEKSDDALRTKALTKALAGAERLANISASLLGFARGGESTTANVKQAVGETLTCLARDLAKDSITLSLSIPEELNVAMNAGQFQQVLMNLIVNARAAMLSAGQVGTKRLTIKGEKVEGVSGKERVRVTIADTGPGIAEEVLPRIFEAFFSTKKVDGEVEGAKAPEAVAKGGTGLGLTICHQLIAHAGGSIEARSEAGRGATFVIELPGG